MSVKKEGGRESGGLKESHDFTEVNLIVSEDVNLFPPQGRKPRHM